jgi:hypothetical protein
MLLADYSYVSSLKPFDLIPVSSFQRAKHRDITRLELVRYMRGETAQDDIVFKTELQDFESFVRPKAVAD